MPRNQRDESINSVVGNNLGYWTSISSEQLTANATATVTISNVAPAAVGTATISSWLPISVGGTLYFIPMWT